MVRLRQRQAGVDWAAFRQEALWPDEGGVLGVSTRPRHRTSPHLTLRFASVLFFHTKACLGLVIRVDLLWRFCR